jgi:hypothetical protein
MERRGVVIYSYNHTLNILDLLINGKKYSYHASPYLFNQIEKQLYMIRKNKGDGYKVLTQLKGKEIKINGDSNSNLA